jgi:2-polyprenyl-3-methyl-5-hydroxy-6-metoxy-1,4-benzoquinol methylase
MICNICESDRVYTRYELYDDRYGHPDTFTVIFCYECNHSFIKFKKKLPDQSKLYSDYYPRSKLNIKNHQPYETTKGFTSWLNGDKSHAYEWVPENIKILDIGCGYGESLAYHQERGCEVYGVDCDENLQKVADYYGFKVKVGNFDSKNYEDHYFNFITLDQVIEHMDKPIDTLKEVRKILMPNGHIIISTPNICGWGQKIFGKYWINWHVPYHLQYFSERSMHIAANKAGLIVKEVWDITSSDWLFYQWFHLLTYPEQGKQSKFWMKNNQLSFNQLMLRKLINLMHTVKLNHLITRLFDSCGYGDSKLYILTIDNNQCS